jgi:hypothetical protein
MIRIVDTTTISHTVVHLRFFDDTEGDYDLSPLIARDTVMTRPLQDPAFVRRCFLELGALCWPNGLELSSPSLRRKLAEQGALSHASAA